MPGKEPPTSQESSVRAPKVTLTSIGSGRKVNLQQTGILTLLVCHGRESADEATQVHTIVRQRFPDTSTLLAASLVNLKIVPRMFRGVAESAIRKAYQENITRMDEGIVPEEYIVILPDWDASVTAALGLHNTPQNPGVAVLDGKGNVLEKFQGNDLPSITVSLLEKYIT